VTDRSWAIHVTVPYPLLARAETLAALAERGVAPEIYFSAADLDALGPGEAEASAAALAAAGVPPPTFHAPFEELFPGARDEEARRLAARRLRAAVDLAPLFRAAGVVMHGGYANWLYDFDPARWLEPARRTFSELAEAAEARGTTIFLENVFDDLPDPLFALREAVGSARIAFCFDAGHATLFSPLPVHRWLETLGPLVRELHIHDNRGRRDDHLPPGEGTINLRGVILAARDAGAHPILTLEAHRREHFLRGTAALQAILSSL